MYKKLEKIVISHLMIILFWGLLFKNNMLVKEDPILNAVSLILFFTLYGLIYTEITNKKIPQRFSVLVIFTSLLPLSLILINDLPYKFILVLISIISTCLFIKKYLVLENIKYINILPISRKSTQIFTIGLVFFIFAGMPSYLARMGLLNDEYAIQFESGSVKHRNISLKEYIDEDKIKPGDVLWHHSKTVYSNNSTPSQFAHVALVTEVNKEKGTVTIIHCTGSSYNNQGLVKQEISVNSSFTWLYRFTNLERDGLY